MAIDPRAVFVRTFAIASSSLLTAAALGAPPAAANDLRDIRIGDHGQLTHVVIEADGPFCADIALNAQPYALSISLPQLTGARPAPRGQGVVSRAQWSNERIVLELKQAARVADAFVVPPGDGKGFRRVVKLERVGAEAFAEAQRGLIQAAASGACGPAADAATRSAAAQAPAKPAAAEPTPQPVAPQPTAPQPTAVKPAPAAIAKPAEQNSPPPVPSPVVKAAAPAPSAATAGMTPMPSRIPKDGKWTVVIDPGHGGDDPGAISPSGLKEKDLTLAMAQVLKRQMEASKRYRVLLTRNDDRLVHLRERTQFADRDDVHLFISLHADTIGAKAIRGLSVYTLSDKASDTESEALAAKENLVDQIYGRDKNGLKTVDTAEILFRMAFSGLGQNSAHFRHLVLSEVEKSDIKVLPSPNRSAGFVVLKTRKVPSVLIEMGYLSNAADEKLLRQARHQERFAGAIIKAANLFFACPEVRKWFAGSEDGSEDQPVAGRGVSCGPSVAEGKGGDGG